ncbi:preprotein translocase subunit SecE [Chloroflexota bacterium]
MKRRGATAKRGSSRFRFFGDIIAELKKVVWLSKREAAYLTGLVIVVAAVVGVILGVIDYGFTRLVNDIFMAGG